jgi:hypothetical protein
MAPSSERAIPGISGILTSPLDSEDCTFSYFMYSIPLVFYPCMHDECTTSLIMFYLFNCSCLSIYVTHHAYSLCMYVHGLFSFKYRDKFSSLCLCWFFYGYM